MTMPENLTETLNSLGNAATLLADEVREDKEARGVEARTALAEQRQQNRRMLSLLVIVAVLVAGLVTIGIANRRLGNANAALNKQNSQIVARIESCTTVGGKCYEQSAGRTKDAVTQLMRVQVAVAQCSRSTDTDTELELCVQHYLDTPPATVPAPTVEPSLPTQSEPEPGTPEPSTAG
jgi:hypothetical protein